MHHTPDSCGNCGGTEHPTPGRITCKMEQDLKSMPGVAVANNVMYEMDCGNCGGTTKPKEVWIPEPPWNPTRRPS